MKGFFSSAGKLFQRPATLSSVDSHVTTYSRLLGDYILALNGLRYQTAADLVEDKNTAPYLA